MRVGYLILIMILAFNVENLFAADGGPIDLNQDLNFDFTSPAIDSDGSGPAISKSLFDSNNAYVGSATLHVCKPTVTTWYVGPIEHSATSCTGIEGKQGALFIDVYDYLGREYRKAEIQGVMTFPIKNLYPAWPWPSGTQGVNILVEGSRFYEQLTCTLKSNFGSFTKSSQGGNQPYQQVQFSLPITSPATSIAASVECTSPFRSFNAGSSANGPGELVFFSNLRMMRSPSSESARIVVTPLDSNQSGVPTPAKEVKDGDVISLPLGGLTALTLVDSSGNPLPAEYSVGQFEIIPAISGQFNIANALYKDRVISLFKITPSNSTQVISMHLGHQLLVITPIDTSQSPITLKIQIEKPIKLGGEKNQYDNIIIDNAHLRGLPPQLIKSLIEHETKGKFDPFAYRYEPETIDLKFLKNPSAKNVVIFKNFLIRNINSPILSFVRAFNPRSIYGIYYRTSRTVSSIKSNYESVERRLITAADILYYNNDNLFPPFGKQNWLPRADSPNRPTPGIGSALGESIESSLSTYQSVYGFTAQTVVASSYGLMQVIHYYAAKDWGFADDAKLALDPTDPTTGLYNPEINIKVGTVKLSKAFTSINSSAQIDGASDFTQYSVLLRKAAQKYNGIGTQATAATILPLPYNNSVWNKWNSFLPR
jgi:hypothetical protein